MNWLDLPSTSWSWHAFLGRRRKKQEASLADVVDEDDTLLLCSLLSRMIEKNYYDFEVEQVGGPHHLSVTITLHSAAALQNS